MRNLVEYVLLFEPEKAPFKHSGTGVGAPGGTDYLKQALLKGECTYRVPANQKLDVPSGAEFFVYPSGISLSTTPVAPFVHSLVMTMADGRLLYAFVYTRYVECDKHVLSVLRMQIAKRLMNDEDDPSYDHRPLHTLPSLSSLPSFFSAHVGLSSEPMSCRACYTALNRCAFARTTRFTIRSSNCSKNTARICPSLVPFCCFPFLHPFPLPPLFRAVL